MQRICTKSSREGWKKNTKITHAIIQTIFQNYLCWFTNTFTLLNFQADVIKRETVWWSISYISLQYWFLRSHLDSFSLSISFVHAPSGQLPYGFQCKLLPNSYGEMGFTIFKRRKANFLCYLQPMQGDKKKGDKIWFLQTILKLGSLKAAAHTFCSSVQLSPTQHIWESRPLQPVNLSMVIWRVSKYGELGM